MGATEIWEVNEPTARFSRWLLELEQRIASELERFRCCFLSPAFPHPHSSTYDLDRFIRGIQPEQVGEPSIVLSLRDERLWGETPEAQLENVRVLKDRLLARFPQAGCAAVGIGGSAPIPEGTLDLRSVESDQTLERHWLALLRGADLVVGVHGSNMLLPSGLARATIELLPEERYGNVFQATLIGPSDPITALATHRTIYGNQSLSDVPAERVAAVAVSVLSESDRFEALMRGPASGESAGAVPLIPASRSSTETVRRPGLAGQLRAAGWKGTARRVGSSVGVASRAAHEQRAAGAARLRARLVRLPALREDERGATFELETRDELATFLRYRGHFERDVLSFCTAAIEPGMTVFDVGANIGAFTANFARAVGSSVRVHAFEPLDALDVNCFGRSSLMPSTTSR